MNKKINHLVDRIVSMTGSGMNNNEIAQDLDCNVPAIRYWQKKLWLKSNPVVPELPAEVKKQILPLYQEYGDAVSVATTLGTTQFRVLKYLKSLGVDTSQRFFKNIDVEEVFEKYNSGMTQEEIAAFYGCDRQAVKELFKLHSFKSRTQVEQSRITWSKNRNAFTDFKDEATLFYYGLLLSDGCISDKGKVSITLQISDAHIIESFKDYLCSKNKIHITEAKGNSAAKATFSFQDREIANRLIAVGMHPRKSTEEKIPSFDLSDINLARHFWRGYICGDGSVRSYVSNNNKDRLRPNLHICGSYEVCKGFADFCESVLQKAHNIEVKKYKDSRRIKELYYFKLTCSMARDVSVFMFDNSTIYINRKKDDVDRFKLYQPAPKNKVYGVYKSKHGKFEVYFCFNGKQKRVGTFENEEDAISLRLRLELEHYGYYKSYNK